MSKAVLISIRPKWCELIASGKKTIEVRKTRPKQETPFKSYIYCTRNGRPLVYGDVPCADGWTEKYTQTYGYNREEADKIWGVMNGKVVGEFVCDEIIKDERGEYADLFERYGCVSLAEQKEYEPRKPIYGWHISNLVIYDEPKPLKKFQIPTTYPARTVRQAPQSWCYIEELP